mmetsp:Transcript_39201/g.95296  ORF Transcript_39201/g.95296 Transcript_39201/m.95296 type:complete len:253 (-) Transcript_39201:37-795(-)
MQLRLHARHRVDHAGQRGHVEGVHHRGRGELEVHRAVHRHGHLVDQGDALLGVDEQPFPVHRHRIDLQRLHIGRQRPALGDAVQRAEGVELVRADPRHRSERDDDQQRRAPDHQFELGRMVPVGRVGGGTVRRAIAPCEPERQRDDRDDDQEHQRGRRDDQVGLLPGDVARRVHHHQVAPGQREAGPEDARALRAGHAHAASWGHLVGAEGRNGRCLRCSIIMSAIASACTPSRCFGRARKSDPHRFVDAPP